MLSLLTSRRGSAGSFAVNLVLAAAIAASILANTTTHFGLTIRAAMQGAASDLRAKVARMVPDVP